MSVECGNIIQCGKIIDFIDSLAPVHLAEEWDNVGLLVGSSESAIKRVLVCLDVTSAVANEAVREQVDLIVSHHPLIFKSMKSVTCDDFKGRIIHKLIKNGISVYSCHTNLDVAEQGVNQALAETLELNSIENLREYGSFVNLPGNKGFECGLGKVGFTKEPINLEKLIVLVKSKLGVDTVRVIGNDGRQVSKTAVFCGSFDDKWAGLLDRNIDVLVTGDIKYHTAMEALEMGLCVIDAGHYNTERIIVPRLMKLLSDNFKDVDIIASTVEEDPFKFS